MMPASKHGDPQIGVDIHLCTVPPSPSPVPLPTPHTSVVFDPFDYVPILGATVTVCGMKRASAGTSATAIHIPPGFPFAPKLPDKDDEIFMGSSTVVADGEPFSFTSVPTLSCQIAGMISPPRLKKKGSPKAMLLPTTVNLAIPTNVFVGGPPTISLMGMAFKLGLSALGRFARSGLFRRIRQRLFKNLKSGFLKCVILRAEPVNILTGEVSVEHEDFTLPGRIPIQWHRTYSSGTHRAGLCGYGWETPADIRLEVDASSGGVIMAQPDGAPLFFERLPETRGEEAAQLELMDGALLTDHGDEWQVRTKEDRIYHFHKTDACTNTEGATEYPVARIADLCGNWLSFKRRNGMLTAINESAGRRIGFVTRDGRITAIDLYNPGTDKAHRFVSYEYDAAGDLTAVVDAMGRPYTFAYDAHHMVRHTDRNGLSFYYAYDPSAPDDWRVVHAWGDGGLYDYTFEYFDELNERRITDSLGHASTVKLNDAGLPISEIDPLGGMTIFEYDDCGRTTAVIDQDQHRTEYAYDDRGNVTKFIFPDGNSIATMFDSANCATAIMDTTGAQWLQKWNSKSLLVEQTTPLGSVSQYKYDASGQLAAYINPLGAHTEYLYDEFGNLISQTNAHNITTHYNYDILGNVIQISDHLGDKIHFKYDLKSRLREVHLPDGALIRCAYDAEDNLTRYVDEAGAETQFVVSGQGKIEKILQADGYHITYQYDTEEQLVGVINQRGERYNIRRDALGRIIEEKDYWGQTRTYSYSKCGYIERTSDPLGRTILYDTDPLGRVIKKSMPHPDGNSETFDETFAYDNNGILSECHNADVDIAREYDADRRLVTERQGENYLIRNSYDQAGNRIERYTEFTCGEEFVSHQVQYHYDELNQVIEIVIDNHSPIKIERNTLGRIVSEQFSTTVRRETGYHKNDFLSRQCLKKENMTIIDETYTYDKAGNLLEKRDAERGVNRYTYDPVGHLISSIDPQNMLQQYLNDPSGYRLFTKITKGTGKYDSEITWHREGEYDGNRYRFDSAGNLIEEQRAKSLVNIKWDANQQLIESSSNGLKTRLKYDPLGRRTSKKSNEKEVYFFWDGDHLLGSYTSIKNKTSDSLKQYIEWVYYPANYEPVAMIQSQITDEPATRNYPNDLLYYYHNDPNGSPTRLFNLSGEIVWAVQYCGWGSISSFDINRVYNPIRLQGQYEDEETGYYYNRYRYYHPKIGQFLSQDPIGLKGSLEIISQDQIGLKGGIYLYKFAPNIFSWIDPLGLSLCKYLRRRLRNIEELAQTPGNKGIRTALTPRELRKVGEAFVGEGHTISRGRRGEIWLISRDGKRMFRSPTPKSSEFARTGAQANFHQRSNVNQNWFDDNAVSNVHVHCK